MNTLREIRRRIQSVINVKQITNAMEKVAVARLHRAQVKAEQSHRYAEKLSKILDHLAQSSSDFNHPFFVPREVKKTGMVIVAADRGLCGSYNSSLFCKADKILKNYTPANVELILIGRKAVNHYQHKKWPIRHQIKEWGGKIQFNEEKSLSHQLVQWYLHGDFDEIWLIYTHFVSIMTREVMHEKFLGLSKPKSQKISQDYIFEPNPAEIYDELLPRYCLSKVQTILDEAYASELAARAFSMRKATKNAEEMLISLTLVRNKIRQAGITKEMIEITTGAEGIR